MLLKEIGNLLQGRFLDLIEKYISPLQLLPNMKYLVVLLKLKQDNHIHFHYYIPHLYFYHTLLTTFR